jgi:uncharacterized protein YwqG
MGVKPDFGERLAAAGLGNHAGALEALTHSSIRLRSERVEEPAIRVGETKLGGRPDLPSSFDWPRYDGLPQSFIAQINLAEVHPCDADGLLPAKGLLSFFYDSAQRVWGFDPLQDGAWAVHYTCAGDDLIRRDPPTDLPAEGSFQAMRLHPSVEVTHAPWECSEVAALNLTRDEQLAYGCLFEDGGETTHRLLGHPDPIQGDMQLECQLVSHGLYCGDSTACADPRAAELEPGAVDWRLLLQVDSDNSAGMMWGDVGMLYYWIHRDALAARDWQQSRLILQCS